LDIEELDTLKQLLIKGLTALNIEPKDEILEKFILLLGELKKWNRAYNLTAITKDKDVIIKHFLDSLLYLKFIPAGNWSICDIGSGAGFPGLPIAFVRHDLNISLLEPSKKKSSFLKHIKRILSMKNVEIMDSRIEDIKGLVFDIAVARAIFSVSELIEKTRNILKENGFLIMNKGPGLADEIKDIPDDYKIEVLTVELPLTSIKRKIVKIQRFPTHLPC